MKFEDMKLTTAQKKELALLNKRNAHKTQELKYSEGNSPAVLTSNTWQFFKITGPTVGTADQNRIGDQIEVKNVELRWSAYIQPGFVVVNGSDSVRVVIFQWTADDTTALVPNSVFQSSGFGISYLSPYTHDTRYEYKILYDDIVTLSSNGPDAVDRVVLVNPARKKVQYINGGVTGTNNIYMAIISDNNTANAPLYDYYFRVHFFDA